MGEILRKAVGGTGGNPQSGAKEFATTSGKKSFCLDFYDRAGGRIQIPLGVVESYPKGTHPEAHNVVVPVFPLRYTTAGPETAQADKLRSGWLYVFRNGMLWRELQVARGGLMADVNLDDHKGKDERPATGSTDTRVLVPYKVNGVEQPIEMAYSEVQWSWARIGSLERDAALRRQRMQQVPLGGYPDFAPSEEKEGQARVENIRSAPNLYWLTLYRADDIPVVYLQDPIGVAKDLATEVYVCKQRYLEGRNQAAEEAGSKNAMAELIFQMGLDSPKVADLVDMDELRDLLKWERQIAHLHALEEAAVALGKYLTRTSDPGVPDIHAAMKDYDEHACVESLLQGQLLSSELVGHLIYGEGRHYLGKSLSQPDHFLVGALHPSQRKVEILGKNRNKVAEFFENLAAATQVDSEVEKKGLALLARIVEQISDGEYTLAQGNFDLASVLAGSAAAGATAKGGYLSSSFTALVRGRFDVAQWVVVKKGLASQMALTLGRSVDWLQTNQPLIKLNAVRLFAVLEVMNLGKAIAGMKSEQNGKQEARAYGAIFTLISLGFTSLKDVKQIGAGWNDKALPIWQQQQLTRKRIVVAGGAHGFGFVGNVIVVALAWNDAWVEYKKGNTGGAVAATVGALGSTILAASTTLGGVVEMNTLGAAGFRGAQAARAAGFGKTKVPLTRHFQVSRVGAGTFAGLAILLLGGVLMYCFSRTPLEQFLARGPFGRDKGRRYTGTPEFEGWRDDTLAEATLFNILFSPSLAPSLQRVGFSGCMIELRIHLPLLFEGKTRIDHTLFGLTAPHFGQPEEKRKIPPRAEGQLVADRDGSHILTLVYDSQAIQDFVTFEAQALVDLYGDGSQVLPVKIEEATLAGHEPVTVRFPEAVRS